MVELTSLVIALGICILIGLLRPLLIIVIVIDINIREI
jgi:hypothetical protein